MFLVSLGLILSTLIFCINAMDRSLTSEDFTGSSILSKKEISPIKTSSGVGLLDKLKKAEINVEQDINSNRKALDDNALKVVFSLFDAKESIVISPKVSNEEFISLIQNQLEIPEDKDIPQTIYIAEQDMNIKSELSRDIGSSNVYMSENKMYMLLKKNVLVTKENIVFDSDLRSHEIVTPVVLE